MAGVILIICGLVGKVGAVLALIPEPIIGGTLLLGLGMVASIGISGQSSEAWFVPKQLSRFIT